MVHMTPGDLPGLPVERLAQFLLGCAREDPTLLARSGTNEIGRPESRARAPGTREPGAREPGARMPSLRASRNEPPRSMPLLLREPGARSDPELEELVSIAVACARRAEDASRHARDVSLSARRRMTVVAAVTGAGVLAATISVVLDHNNGAATSRLADVASAVNGMNELQRRTVAQIAGVVSDITALRGGVGSGHPAGEASADKPAAGEPMTAARNGAGQSRQAAVPVPVTSVPVTSVPVTSAPEMTATREVNGPSRSIAAITRAPAPEVTAARETVADRPGASADPSAAVPPTTASVLAREIQARDAPTPGQAPGEAAVSVVSRLPTRSSPDMAPPPVSGQPPEPAASRQAAAAPGNMAPRDVGTRVIPAATRVAVPLTATDTTPDPDLAPAGSLGATPVELVPRPAPTSDVPTPRPLTVAAHPRPRYSPPRPAWQQAHAYRPPVQTVAVSRPQFVLAQVYEGVRRNIYAIFH